jgi:B12-binding domain/radical SAM domain protein
VRMMNDRGFSVPKFLARQRARAVGIDLHWLPHAHGALEIARLVKEAHPETPVMMGGLSSTYFHEELIRYPQVDYVVRGDSTEPVVHALLEALGDGAALARVPNLTWKPGGEPRANPMTFMPDSLDYADLRPDRMVQMVVRHRDIQSVLPYSGWLRYPITAVFTVKGCSCECVTCGSSHETCTHLTRRSRPVFRGPESLVANIEAVARLTRSPIFLVGDLLQAGADHAAAVLEGLRRAALPNEIMFEFFDLPPLEFLRRIDDAVPVWSVEISPESHDHAVRRAQEGEPAYDNARLEAFLQEALRRRARRIGVFFMIGLPEQTYESVMDTIEYCGRLFQMSDRRLSCFISPMGPFIDPGSRGFEEPERFGYRLFARTLDEHRRLLTQPTWERILNYETRWMSRERLVDATYDAAERLNAMKLEHGRISPRHGRAVARRIETARALRRRINDSEGGDPEAAAALKGEVVRFSQSTVCDKRELFWARRLVNFNVGEIARLAWRALAARKPHTPGI